MLPFALCIFLILIIAFQIGIVNAQNGSTLRILSVQVDAFPRMRMALEVYDDNGNFLPGIKTPDVIVIENGEDRSLSKLELIEPGLQTLFAINISPEFAAQTGTGNYLEKVKNGLLAWSQTRISNGLDDFSLIDNTGLRVIRSTDIRQWEQAVTEYAPDLYASRQSLAALNMALDLALESNPRQYMKRSILYVSSPPLVEHGQALPNLADRAVQQGVEVNIWLVPSVNIVYPEGIEMLRALAQATGGSFVQLSAQEELPAIEDYFQPLRFIYEAEYLSEIIRSGNQSIAIKIDTTDYQSVSQAFPFKLDVLPPNPIFLSPPTQVLRSWVVGEDEGEDLLEPVIQPIEILIEFQDGHPRDLERTTLYANGEVAAENVSPPFDKFEWNLGDIEETDRFSLQVEAVDTLGLSQQSILVPVDIVVEEKELTILERITSQGPLPIIIAISFAGVIGLSIYSLVRGKPLELGKKKFHKSPQRVSGSQLEKEKEEQDREILTRNDHAWPQTGISSDGPARLTLINGEGLPAKDKTIILNRKEITFGSDPKQATHILRSRTVSGLHARMIQSSGDTFTLADAGSIAGTWVNLAPVPAHGKVLKHGDQIHIGEFAFRFELRKPPEGSRIKVFPLEKGDIL